MPVTADVLLSEMPSDGDKEGVKRIVRVGDPVGMLLVLERVTETSRERDTAVADTCDVIVAVGTREFVYSVAESDLVSGVSVRVSESSEVMVSVPLNVRVEELVNGIELDGVKEGRSGVDERVLVNRSESVRVASSVRVSVRALERELLLV